MILSPTRPWRSVALVLALLLAGAGPRVVAADPAADPAADSPAYLDLLDLHGTPKNPADRSFNIFFDAGAWHGYSLPPAGDASSGFSGPFVHNLAGGGQWAGARFARLLLHAADGGEALVLAPVDVHAGPGFLQRDYAAPGLTLRQTLFYADSWRAVARIEITATATRELRLAVAGDTLPAQGSRLGLDGDAVVQTFAASPARLVTRLHADGHAGRAVLDGGGYRIALAQPLHLEAGRTTVVFVDQSLLDAAPAPAGSADDATAWLRNRERWHGYLAAIRSSRLPGVDDAVARRVAAKAVITLLGNWRAARGDLHHDGVVPSYSNPDFNGFWAWDSWKHAAALAHFAPELARDQMRAMFDYQAADGMVPDCIYQDKAENNWRDTKPPLATWATLEIYRATGDRAFVAEMYDKLVRYHRWWFAARDHDRNGLAEYGSTDGSRIAAAWESGMDNAVRFDRAKMLRNGAGAWSLDQESVDLNAYLYKEKLDLAELADVLGKRADAATWRAQAAAMKAAIQARMFDQERGYFFDARLGSGDLVRVYGSEGWAPLWAGVASAGQAEQVIRVMLDPGKFATYMPFPTLAADDPRFSPIKGYWRGPVWLDQAWFGVEALRRYGHAGPADDMARRLVLHARGLAQQAPIYENYDPLTGRGYQSPNFSWSAAAYLLLLREGTSERGVR